MVMGFQNVSQLRSIYGRDRTTTLTSAPTTKVILRCDEAETAEWASEQLGRHEVVRVEMTALAGLSYYREGINLQPHRRVEAIRMGGEGPAKTTSFGRRNHLLRRVGQIGCRQQIQAALLQDLAPLGDVGAFQTHHE